MKIKSRRSQNFRRALCSAGDGDWGGDAVLGTGELPTAPRACPGSRILGAVANSRKCTFVHSGVFLLALFFLWCYHDSVFDGDANS